VDTDKENATGAKNISASRCRRARSALSATASVTKQAPAQVGSKKSAAMVAYCTLILKVTKDDTSSVFGRELQLVLICLRTPGPSATLDLNGVPRAQRESVLKYPNLAVVSVNEVESCIQNSDVVGKHFNGNGASAAAWI
jgi:hypothetical protein